LAARLRQGLEGQKVALLSLHEAIDTATTSGKLTFHLFGALAEFERNLIRERTQAGLAAARSRGKKGGRPTALNKDKRDLAVKLYHENTMPIAKICSIIARQLGWPVRDTSGWPVGRVESRA